jgi:hypothetical protein
LEDLTDKHGRSIHVNQVKEHKNDMHLKSGRGYITFCAVFAQEK